MRSMVEGYAPMRTTPPLHCHRPCPSTTLRVVPLPRWGRN